MPLPTTEPRKREALWFQAICNWESRIGTENENHSALCRAEFHWNWAVRDLKSALVLEQTLDQEHSRTRGLELAETLQQQFPPTPSPKPKPIQTTPQPSRQPQMADIKF